MYAIARYKHSDRKGIKFIVVDENAHVAGYHKTEKEAKTHLRNIGALGGQRKTTS